MKDNYMCGLFRRVMPFVLLLLMQSVQAGEHSKVSPALEVYPSSLIQSLRNCTAIRRGSFYLEPRAVDLLESWFTEFTNPAYSSLFDDMYRPLNMQYASILQDVTSRMNEVKLLADYRTEQAFISMLDALVSRHGRGSQCQNVSSILLLRVAAQRDRAWAWAEVVNRNLNMAGVRLQGDRVARELEESLRALTLSYESFDHYRLQDQ